MERWVAKAISLIIIYVSILTVTLLPIWVSDFFTRQGARGRAILSGISCFSGGIFLAAYLLVMAPEIRALLETSLLVPNGIHYPIPELTIGAGFFFIVTVELIVMKVKSCGRLPRSKPSEHNSDARPVVVGNATDIKETETVSIEFDNVALDDNKETADDRTNRVGNTRNAEDAIADHGTLNRKSSLQLVILNGDEPEPKVATKPTGNGTIATGEVVDVQAVVIEGVSEEDIAQQHVTRSIVLLMALSLDSVFEGMAVGLKTTIPGVWNLMVAIVAHEIVISFGLGLQLVKHHPRRRVIVIGLVYSLMTPLGGTVGAIVMESLGRSAAMDTTNGILQGITAGIFIYVTFFEILNAEFSDGITTTRLGMTMLGFVAMATLKALSNDDVIAPTDSLVHRGNWTLTEA